MWAFLIGVSDKRFLCASRLVQFVRVRDGWAQTCQQKEVGEKPKSVYSKQWKSSSNLKAFFLKKKKKLWENSFMAMQNVYVNWSAGFTRVFQSLLMRCRVFCNLADTGWRQNKSGNYDINGQNKLPNIAIQVKGEGRVGWRHVSFQTRSRHFWEKRKPKKLNNIRLFGSNKKLKA